MQGLVDPDDFDERREIRTKSTDGDQTEAAPDERVGLDENV